MEPQFWHSRWQANEIGFHEGRPNDLLVAHLSDLDLEKDARLFVPLCGKAQDLPWLASQGFGVVGVELSAAAVAQLFAEAGVKPTIARAGTLTRYSGGGMTIYAGDLFALTREDIGEIDAIYDRASLVALPHGMRTRYAAKLHELAGTAKRLLITFEYDQLLADGPPFSIGDAEIARLFGSDYTAEKREDREVAGGLKGKTPAREAAWILTPTP